MFNGVNLDGWVNPFDWGKAVAQGGQILLQGTKNFWLVSRNTYANFILEADVLLPPLASSNSGLQFRSQYGHNFMKGYQADVDATHSRNWAGSLYYQTRGWLVFAHPRAPTLPGQWNHYVVEAIGNHIEISVNGTVTVNTYKSIDSVGHIALQDDGFNNGVIRFKNVEIEDLGP